jgi:hypothetical protein
MAILTISRDWGVEPSIVRITTDDNLAAITTAGYLTAEAADIEAIQNGDFEWVDSDVALIVYDGGEAFFTRDAVNETFVAAATVPGTLSDTLADGHIFVGSALNVATDVAMSGDVHIINTGATTIQNNAVTTAKIIDAAVTSAKLDPTTIQYVKVPMTAAQFNGMYAAPFVLIAAPAAGHMIVVKQAVLAMTFVAAQYANGGVVALQYDNTVHGAGPAASATIAAATIQGYAASSDVGVLGADTSGASNTKVAKGIYLSNDTAAFDTGDGTWNVHIWYEVVTL